MEEAMKKIVSARLKAQATGSHPDSEMLNAYAENQLLRQDRESLLTHLAECADCRDALYLAMPHIDSHPVVTPAHKRPRFAVRWATLGASVVILGTVLLTNREMFYQHSPSVQRYTSAPQQQAELNEPIVASQPADARVPAMQATAKVRPPAKHMTAKPQASMQFDQSGQVHFAAAPAAEDASQMRNESSQLSQAQAQRTDLAKVISPVATMHPVWRLSADGMPQRSLDGAQTWEAIPLPGGTKFHAINSIGHEVWAGGNAGALYHSADAGQSWTKIDPFSTDDITHIEFSDPQNGLLNTATGRVWSTSDGGRSWHSK